MRLDIYRPLDPTQRKRFRTTASALAGAAVVATALAAPAQQAPATPAPSDPGTDVADRLATWSLDTFVDRHRVSIDEALDLGVRSPGDAKTWYDQLDATASRYIEQLTYWYGQGPLNPRYQARAGRPDPKTQVWFTPVFNRPVTESGQTSWGADHLTDTTYQAPGRPGPGGWSFGSRTDGNDHNPTLSRPGLADRHAWGQDDSALRPLPATPPTAPSLAPDLASHTPRWSGYVDRRPGTPALVSPPVSTVSLELPPAPAVPGAQVRLLPSERRFDVLRSGVLPSELRSQLQRSGPVVVTGTTFPPVGVHFEPYPRSTPPVVYLPSVTAPHFDPYRVHRAGLPALHPGLQRSYTTPPAATPAFRTGVINTYVPPAPLQGYGPVNPYAPR